MEGRLLGRDVPENILVIGRTGVGKSTLINAMFGAVKAKATHGTKSVTSDVQVCEGEHDGFKFKFYDTPGLRDTGGKSCRNILLDVANRSHFDRILICTKLQDKADPRMFSELASRLHADVWKRTVVVLTFANHFITLKSVKESNDLENEVKVQVNDLKGNIVNLLSKNSIKIEVLDEIPFCIAGLIDEKGLPTTEDWLTALWDKCRGRCTDDTRPFLSFYTRNRGYVDTGSFLGVAGALAGLGAAVGSVVPIAGTAIGAGVGGAFGAIASLVGIGYMHYRK